MFLLIQGKNTYSESLCSKSCQLRKIIEPIYDYVTISRLSNLLQNISQSTKVFESCNVLFKAFMKSLARRIYGSVDQKIQSLRKYGLSGIENTLLSLSGIGNTVVLNRRYSFWFKWNRKYGSVEQKIRFSFSLLLQNT